MADITQKFRESDEYKTLSKFILADNPGMPQALIDIAIWYHKLNPQAYKDKTLQRLGPCKQEKPNYDNAVTIETPPTITPV